MSYRSGHHSEYLPRHTHDHGRTSSRRPAGDHVSSHPAQAQEGYTLVHAGKQVRFGPVVFWIVVGTVTVLGMWSAATATYFAFRDDVLTRLVARQAEMQYAYEDRIAELRAKVDRTTSRQLLDQEQFDQKLDQIMRRQTTLESRATALGAIPDAQVTGSIRSPSRGTNPADTAASGTPKPSPISDTAIFVAPPDREARLESRAPVTAKPLQTSSRKSRVSTTCLSACRLRSIRSRAARWRRSTRSKTASNCACAGCAASSPISASTWRNWKPRRRAPAWAALTFPSNFRPTPAPSSASSIGSISPAPQMERLNRTLALVPYRKPVIGEVEFTSGFGIRNDPFLGRPAMHTGLDFRAAMGDPVRATANGKVASAGWAGGYGRMVEIDHGNGLSTRYGHLSEIGVKVGDQIKIGQVIGAVGSTGRSTGPHLHYETRIDGEAVDPQKFLRAGVRLTAG